MAKAALNMITRTIADDYFSDYNIIVNSVDTGWVNNMGGTEYKKINCPLSIVDGAMRVLDPILSYYNSNIKTHGKLYKDYQISNW
jgi:NAD(P)-dependent dehydrogenase (short-subunit alcohol dehydrogenase family)